MVICAEECLIANFVSTIEELTQEYEPGLGNLTMEPDAQHGEPFWSDRFTSQLHSRLLWVAATLFSITVRAGDNHVVPFC